MTTIEEAMSALAREHGEEPGWTGLPEWDTQGYGDGRLAPTPLYQQAWRLVHGEEPTPENVLGG